MTTPTPTDDDVIAVLMQDHREVEAMFTELDGLRGQDGDTANPTPEDAG